MTLKRDVSFVLLASVPAKMGTTRIVRRLRTAGSLRAGVVSVPWWCWILILVAVEGALWLLLFSPAPAPDGDGQQYQQLASNLLHHGAFSAQPGPPYYPTVLRTPGYPVFLAFLFWLGGSHAVVVQAAQFAVVAGTAILVGLIGRMMVGATAGTLAAVLCATYLPMLGYAARYLTESLACLGVTSVIALLVFARRSDRLRDYVALGVALAALTYVRPESALLAVPIAAALLLGRKGSGWRSGNNWNRCLSFAAVFVVALVPWMIRNTSVTGGRIVPMAATSGVDLLTSADQYSGYLTYEMKWPQDWQRIAAQNARIAPISPFVVGARAEVRRDDELRSGAIRIFESLPIGKLIGSIPKRIAYLWGIADGHTTLEELYWPPPGRWANAGERLAQLQYGLLILLGLAGLVLRRRFLLGDWPLWLTAVYLSVLHLVSHVEDRYTLLARPLLMIYPAVAVLALVSLLPRSFLRRRGLARAFVDRA